MNHISFGRKHGGHTVAMAAALAASLVLAGCQTAGKRTAIGAGGGAALGAGVGALIGGGKGAVIGAGVGAAAGGSVGLYLDKQQKELEKVAQTRRTDNGLMVQLKNDILFDSGSATLRPEAVEQLSRLGAILARYSDDRIVIEGHTDAVGAASLNESLSLRRAEAVKSVLLGKGVREKQVQSRGMGESEPVAGNGNATGRAKNRRVELHIDVPNAT